MVNLKRLLQHLLVGEKGQTLSEYGLILLLIFLVAIIATTLLGNQISAALTQAANMF